MALITLHSEQAPKVYGPYSQATAVDQLIFASGQLPLDPTTMELVGPGIREQATQVLVNLRAVLRAGGSDLSRVAKTTLFLVDLADFQTFNEVYAEMFSDNRPARTTVGVASLPRGARVELDAIAFR